MILVADENSFATPSPVHGLYATLESRIQRQNMQALKVPMVARLYQSRLMVITALAALCWALVGAITWLIFY